MSTLQAITCKGVVCWGAAEPWKVEEIQVEPPKSTEVRVKMIYASICHTDVILSKGFPSPLFPRVLGHEGVGVVESVGDEVKEFKEGDVVIPTYIGECKECENCKLDMANLCQKYPFSLHGLMLDGTSRMSIRGQKLYHLFSCSTMAEYMVVDANYVVKIDPSCIDLSHATFLSCGYTTGFGSAWKEFKVERGSSVAVFGLGAVGLGVIDGARVQGAGKIIGIDKNPWKKEKGEAFGMTDFINPCESKKPILELVKDITNEMGVDYSFECTGIPPLLSEAIEVTKLGKGKVMVIGSANEMSVPVNIQNLAYGKTLKGTIFGGIKTKSELPIILDKYKNKQIQIDHLLTHEVTLEEIDKAVELMKQPDCVKILIKII